MAKKRTSKANVSDVPPGIAQPPQQDTSAVTSQPSPPEVEPPVELPSNDVVQPRMIVIHIPIVQKVSGNIPRYCNLGRVSRRRARVLKMLMRGLDETGEAPKDGGWRSGSIAINSILDRIADAIDSAKNF